MSKLALLIRADLSWLVANELLQDLLIDDRDGFWFNLITHQAVLHTALLGFSFFLKAFHSDKTPVLHLLGWMMLLLRQPQASPAGMLPLFGQLMSWRAWRRRGAALLKIHSEYTLIRKHGGRQWFLEGGCGGGGGCCWSGVVVEADKVDCGLGAMGPPAESWLTKTMRQIETDHLMKSFSSRTHLWNLLHRAPAASSQVRNPNQNRCRAVDTWCRSLVMVT